MNQAKQSDHNFVSCVTECPLAITVWNGPWPNFTQVRQYALLVKSIDKIAYHHMLHGMTYIFFIMIYVGQQYALHRDSYIHKKSISCLYFLSKLRTLRETVCVTGQCFNCVSDKIVLWNSLNIGNEWSRMDSM